MKSYFFLFVGFLFMISCGGAGTGKGKQTPTATPLKGYFIKNTVEDNGDFQCYVFEDQQAFSQVCGVAATMSSKPDAVDFRNDIVVAIAGKSTNRPTNIQIVKTDLEKGTLTVFIAEEIGEEELTYTLRPLVVATVEKAGIKKVVFRKGLQDIYSITL